MKRSKPAARAADTTTTTTPPPASPPARKRIFLVDDHPITLAGMRQLIESEPGLSVCGTARSAEEALTLIGTALPEMIITDVTLPGKNGIEFTKDLQTLHPGIPILIVTMHDELIYAERALRAGARGFLMKEATIDLLLDAIAQILAGRIFVSERMSSQILQNLTGQKPRGSKSPIERLSDREFEVFQLLGQGRTTHQIAQQLHLSPKTVDVHRAHIKEKLGIGNVTELVSYAVRWLEAKSAGKGA